MLCQFTQALFIAHTYIHTVEPPNKGHFGDDINLTGLFFVERFSSLGGLNVL